MTSESQLLTERLELVTLFAGWTVRWVQDDPSRVAGVLAWLDQYPQLTGDLPELSVGILGGGMGEFIKYLDEIMRRIEAGRPHDTHERI